MKAAEQLSFRRPRAPLVLPLLLSALLLVGCGTPQAQPRVGTAAPPLKVCDRVLSSSPAGVDSFRFYHGSRLDIPGFISDRGGSVLVRFNSGCVQGVFLVGASPRGILSIRVVPASSHKSNHTEVVAILLTGRSRGVATVTVRRPDGQIALVEVRVGS